jgi:hypothetical protein
VFYLLSEFLRIIRSPGTSAAGAAGGSVGADKAVGGGERAVALALGAELYQQLEATLE